MHSKVINMDIDYQVMDSLRRERIVFTKLAGSMHASTMAEGFTWSDSEYRLQQFINLVSSQSNLQVLIRDARTLREIAGLSRKFGTPVEEIDLALSYRYLNQDFWPWHGRPMQHRRHFVHQGGLPPEDLK